MEGYYTPGSRFDRAPFDFGDKLIDEEGDGGNNRGKAAYTHMTLLARTTEGMHNLFRISSLASLEGQYRKPRFDRDLLERYGKGLIATTGCPSGEVNMWLRAGKEDRARQAAADFQDIFGKENFYAEMMDHGLSIEKKTKPALLAIAKDLGIPLLGTNDLHYTHKEDAQAHDALLCIQTGSRLNETNRFRFNGDGYYLKSAAEMRALFADMPEACDNTLLVAEQCEVTFTEGADLMPRFPLPEGEDETSWFVKEVERGLHKRWPERHPRPRAQAGRLRDRDHHARWASRGTSSWSPTSSTGPRTRASGSARAVARPPARWPPTRWASPTSTRWPTA